MAEDLIDRYRLRFGTGGLEILNCLCKLMREHLRAGPFLPLFGGALEAKVEGLEACPDHKFG